MKVYIVKYAVFEHFMEGYGFDKEYAIIANDKEQAWYYFFNWFAKLYVPKATVNAKFSIEEMKMLPEPTSEPQNQ